MHEEVLARDLVVRSRPGDDHVGLGSTADHSTGRAHVVHPRVFARELERRVAALDAYAHAAE